MNAVFSCKAIIFAPRGRDGGIAGRILREAGIDSVAVGDFPHFIEELRGSSAFAIIAEEALGEGDLGELETVVRAQEEWSDLPFIVLTKRGGDSARNPAARRYLDLLGNVTFIERPFHPTTLASGATAALRARLRQYDAHARLQTIREGERQLRIAMTAGRLGSWSFELRTLELTTSPECKMQFGRSPDQVFGFRELIDSIHPDDRAAMEHAVRHALTTGGDFDIESRCIWPDQSTHWAEVRGQSELDKAGHAVRVAGVSQDITERKQADETLRHFTIELEQRVAERTREHEIISAQLHEAQKLEMLGQLTGGVAHDFNNLLTPIVGSLDLARRRTDEPRLHKMLDGALQAAERARVLVNRLLSFARRQNLETRPSDVADLVDGMADLIRRSIGPTIALDIRLERGAPPAMVDPNQLELALLNLAINARDAMPDGGRITISVMQAQVPRDHATLSPGCYVCIAVADAGIGMDAATLTRAVEPFYSTKGIGKGTGLGLSMVHGLAAQLGGGLTLTSAPGQGTTAELWLPAIVGVLAEPRFAAERVDIKMPALDVLLVDDEDVVREGTAAMLQELGHAVFEARSGASALQLVRARPFDLVVTDYLMPGMNGVNLAREARMLRADLPVLIITGFADLTESSGLGFTRLAKPFRIGELGQAVQEASAGAIMR